MDAPWIIVVLTVIICWLTYHFIVYPALLSPLAKLPNAHPLCAVTSIWFHHQSNNSRELKTLYAVHQKHGPVVRLGPNEVSVVSQQGLKKVYATGLDKSAWYRESGLFMAYGVQNLVCTLDHATHSKIRRTIAPLYAKSHLQRSEDLDALSKGIIFHKLLPMLQGFANESKHVDVVQLSEWTAIDFTSAYIFGMESSTDFLQDKASREEYFGEWDRLRKSPETHEKPITEDLFKRICISALSHENAHASTLSRVVSRMYASLWLNAGELNLSDEEVMRRCASEMLDHIIATQMAQPVAWTYILYHLSQRPQLQETLRRELRELRPQISVIPNKSGGQIDPDAQSLPSPSDIDSLPILDAVVHETLRLHAANPARLPRVVPSNGLELHGYYIPPDTTISTNAYCLHRHAEAFPKPFEWQAERWLPRKGDEASAWEGREAKERWFWAFGSGPRMCIGQHFAVQVLKLAVAAIYTNFTTSIVDDEGIEQSDAYNSAPISHRLILQFHPVN